MSVIFDGHDFSELFYVGDPEITIANSIPDLRDVSGRDGSMFVGSRFGNSNVAFTLALEGDAYTRRCALSVLASWLDVDEPKKLVLPDTPDRYYLAVPDAALELKRAIGAELTKVSFALVDPVAYGREVEITVPSGSSIKFNVNGSYKTYPIITASSAVRDSTSLVWGVKLDGDKFIHIATGSASATLVEIDCGARTSTITSSKTVKLPTLNPLSDWLYFEPGIHTLLMDEGTGAATVKYRERWL